MKVFAVTILLLLSASLYYEFMAPLPQKPRRPASAPDRNNAPLEKIETKPSTISYGKAFSDILSLKLALQKEGSKLPFEIEEAMDELPLKNQKKLIQNYSERKNLLSFLGNLHIALYNTPYAEMLQDLLAKQIQIKFKSGLVPTDYIIDTSIRYLNPIWFQAKGAMYLPKEKYQILLKRLNEYHPSVIDEFEQEFSEVFVNYLKEYQKDFKLLQFQEGRIIFQGSSYDTLEALEGVSDSPKAIVILNSDLELYHSLYQKKGHFHHSALATAENIIFSGEIVVENGQLKHISNRSGPYSSSPYRLKFFLDFLVAKQVSLENVSIDLAL